MTSPAAAPREPRRSEAREAILAAAAHRLSTAGYHATTLREVAADVGLQAGSLYHHFASKDALVAEVMNQGVQVVHEAVEAVLARAAELPGRERLTRAIEAHLRASLEHSAFTSAAIKSFSFVPEAVRADNRRHRRAYEDLWSRLIDALADEGLLPSDVSRESARLLLLGAMNWAGEWSRRERADLAAVARDFARLVTRP